MTKTAKAVISDGKITSADEPKREKRCGRSAKTICGSLGIFSGTQKPVNERTLRCRAGPIYPKAAVAGCIATTSSAYNGTPVQPQPHAMGTARREPRRGESPGANRQVRFCQPPFPSGEVVSNTDGNMISETAGLAGYIIYGKRSSFLIPQVL